MHRCWRAFPSSTALMASVSSQASPGPRLCRRAVPVSSCSGRRPAKASSSALMTPWRSERSLKMRSCSTKRQVSSGNTFQLLVVKLVELLSTCCCSLVLISSHFSINTDYVFLLPIKCWTQVDRHRKPLEDTQTHEVITLDFACECS